MEMNRFLTKKHLVKPPKYTAFYCILNKKFKRIKAIAQLAVVEWCVLIVT